MEQMQIDIFVITEAKRWTEEYTRKVEADGKGVILAVDDSHRGGVALITRLDRVQAMKLGVRGTTMIHATVHFENGRLRNKRQSVHIVASYVNPKPTTKEKEDIEVWMATIEDLLLDSTHPMIVIGDVNSNGHASLKKAGGDIMLDAIGNRVTWVGHMRLSNGKRPEGTPDVMKARNVHLSQVSVKDVPSYDHMIVRSEIPTLIAQRPPSLYTK